MSQYRLAKLDQKVDDIQSLIPTNLLKPAETSGCSKQTLNLMVYRPTGILPESSSSSVSARIQSDMTEFMKLVNFFTPGREATNLRCHRAGKLQRNPPLKVVFSRAELPTELLEEFLKRCDKSRPCLLRHFYISRQNQFSEQKNLKTLEPKLQSVRVRRR